jgi:hypothetical protein
MAGMGGYLRVEKSAPAADTNEQEFFASFSHKRKVFFF